VAALGGAFFLFTHPFDAMGPVVLERLPFDSYVWPGILLAACVALPAAAVAAGALARLPAAHVGHPLLGLTLIGWIVVQVLIIGPYWLQPVVAAWGAVLFGLGAANYRRWHAQPIGTGRPAPSR
jgi:hypothetical protein